MNKLKVLVLLIISILHFSCEPPAPECIPRPYTKREQFFVDSLENLGVRVTLSRWDNIPCDLFNDGAYTVFIDELDEDVIYDVDSLRNASRILARQLYNEIIEDSIVFIMPKMIFSYQNKNTLKNGENSDHLEIVIQKSDLEKTFGKKIIEKGKNNFEVIKVKVLYDTLPINEQRKTFK